jgi:signal transduction histidine kinase
VDKEKQKNTDPLVSTDNEIIRLKKYYYTVYITGPIVILFLGIIIKVFSNEIKFIFYPNIALIIYLIMFVFQIISFIANEIKPNKYFWLVQCLFWVAFDIAIATVSGGIDSPLLFILAPTIIAASSRLSHKETKIIGIVTIFSLVILTLLNFSQLTDPSYLILSLTRLMLYSFFVYFVYALIKDTLEQKYEKEQVKKKFIELTEINHVKETFLTITSHQLKTPLTATKWALESLLGRADLIPEVKDMLQISKDRVDTSIDIISDMLQSADYDSKNLLEDIEKNKVNLNNLIKKILSELSISIQKNNVRIHTDIKDQNITINGNENILYFAIENVIDNAIKYSPNKEVNIKITKNNNKVEILVTDNGIGISSSDLPFIFEKFYRGKNAISVDPNQSGVGLYSSKKVIELHGGNIYIDSIINDGTKVKIILPLANTGGLSLTNKQV